MTNKIKTLILCSVLSVAAFCGFANASESVVGQQAKCDASNPNKCVIYNVGEGTGALIVEQ